MVFFIKLTFRMLIVLNYCPLFSLAQQAQEKSLAKKKRRGLFRSLRRATAERGGSAKPFEKGLSENFPLWSS
jgi:hypothetical protein